MPVEMLRRPPGVWRASFSLVLCRESVSKSQTLENLFANFPSHQAPASPAKPTEAKAGQAAPTLFSPG